jgi:hypothetical protein
MTKKEQIIELLDRYGNETDLFKAFITKDEFSNLADDLVKLFAIPDVVGRSEQFVCGHPPKQTYLLNGTYHCEKCGGKWESIANK